MKDSSIARVRRTSMLENRIDPFSSEEEVIIIDSKNDLRKENFEAQGYEVQVLDLSNEKSQNVWNPYQALEQLAKEDPDRFKVVVEELEKTIMQKND
ncbi:hypothetical protein [Enterococcus sp. CWB-B31]|uniref:hypothetical protein n=1 Tax=Enterococcus sp. CWB-B31 TaxID=2885159 RepID=UPI001E478FAE|nr:hypothetical protein [Enterococcus sp. CWB-B31]MCB5954604.1 hypothetical protein [Enterococcus sp. CWB-B31]